MATQPERFMAELTAGEFTSELPVGPATSSDVVPPPMERGVGGSLVGPDYLAAVTVAPSKFEEAKRLNDLYPKVDTTKLNPAQLAQFEEDFAHNVTELGDLIDQAMNTGVRNYLYRDVRNLYREITAEPAVSRYGEETRRMTMTERIEMAQKAL